MVVVMTIAGSDSGGGAGIQGDIKTFQEIGVFGTTVVTAITAQNTLGVERVHTVPTDFIVEQMVTVFRDFPIRALKTGMFFTPNMIEEVALTLKNRDVQLVIDPVGVAKVTVRDVEMEALRTYLLPLATVITPSVPEAAKISGIAIHEEADVERAAKKIVTYGVQCVVIKGSELNQHKAVDTAYFADGTVIKMESPRIHAVHNKHGSGCTFSAALTAFLGKGYPLLGAIVEAKKFVHAALSHPLEIGNGNGPINHAAYHTYQSQVEVVVREV